MLSMVGFAAAANLSGCRGTRLARRLITLLPPAAGKCLQCPKLALLGCTC
jgi:hypothetical protein